MYYLFIIFVSLALLVPGHCFSAQLKISTLDEETGEPMPARLHLTDVNGDPLLKSVSQLPSFRNHVSSPGLARFEVVPGRYLLIVERGPEWVPVSESISISSDKGSTSITVTLRRLVNMAREGWWSGETHIHRPIDQVELLMCSEDLHFGQVISWWNQNNPWNTDPLPSPLIRRFDTNRFAQWIAGEDERDGGALLYFNLKQALDVTAGRKQFPSSLVYAKAGETAGAWIDIEKPFWWDVPMWIANGIGDSIGIANNHHYRHGMLENEAWGKPRDTIRLPNPQGNGWWTQEIYHHLLNCGIRIPPSAGSASGVLPNPVGYNRAYVHFEGEPTMDKWFEGMKAGRVFVSNGPLLRVRANGQLPGHVFRTDKDFINIELLGAVDSNDPIDRIEIVHNGQVMTHPFPGSIPIHESGWFLVRAIVSKKNTLRFAATAPFYVELGGERLAPQQNESAQFFIQWCEERMTSLRANAALSSNQKEEILQPWHAALAFWNAKQEEVAPLHTVRVEVIDADTRQLIPTRVYIKDYRGGWHFVASEDAEGSAVRYEKQNWIQSESQEFHTTVSAHPFEAKLPSGTYEWTIEHGKEYFTLSETVVVGDDSVELRLPLKRWVNMAKRRWYSGDTHVHRTLEDLPNTMLAENLNVAFPLTYWVTQAFTTPISGDKTTHSAPPDALISVDDTHVIWPRNTEWEIFSIGSKRHTLGAVFALGHQEPFELGVPTVKEVALEARRQGALLDLDKHDWPWSMTLPPTMGIQLYELANNHMWRTKFAFTNWSSPTPKYMRPPLNAQSGNEREWIQFTLANYYALLNCGVNMVPTAGTASGVHPVPLGFGRVYVEQPDGFSYENWISGLKSGRSFVTTGPMVFTTLNDKPPGQLFQSKGLFPAAIKGEILSEHPLSFAEIISNGEPIRTIMGRNQKTGSGAYRTEFQTDLPVSQSGWFAVRAWEDRPGGRVRFAHTSPWHIQIQGQPLLPSFEERKYLIDRVNLEIERSKALLPIKALKEYEEARKFYESLPVRTLIDASARGDAWDSNDWVGVPNRVRVVPYPGGVHPRAGFLEGAINPQRETKITVFTPWDTDSYVVVDVPEAIWSNLGLTYLAHTHIDTIWDRKNFSLPQLEWNVKGDGSLSHERILPNGITFGAEVEAHEKYVEMELWLENGTPEKLTDLRVQNCVMLKGAKSFDAQSNWNKSLQTPYALAHSEDRKKWIITAWERCLRLWANPPVPCMHSDPQFPDLEPGESHRIKGWVWFYEGEDVDAELKRLSRTHSLPMPGEVSP